MKEGYFFSNVDIKYDDYLRIIKEKMQNSDVDRTYDIFPKGVDALESINSPEKQEQLIDISIKIDRNLTSTNSKKINTEKKLAAMMATANLIANHYDEISHLNNKQLAVLGHCLHFYTDEEVDNSLHIFANNELLDTVMKKTKDSGCRYEILSMVKDQCPNECYDKNNILEINNFQKQMIDVIKNSSLSEIMDMQKTGAEISANMETEGFKI